MLSFAFEDLSLKHRQILANGLYPVGYYRKGTLFDRLGLHALSTQYLMPALIRFFIGAGYFLSAEYPFANVR